MTRDLRSRLRCGLIGVLWSLPGWSAEPTVIHAGALIDARAGKVLSQQTIVVADGVIQAVEAGYRAAPDAIDLTSATVMPGWIDMHVHIATEQSPERQLERFTLESSDHAFRSVAFAERTLLAGFTTVRDLGTVHGIAQSLRRAVDEGWVDGPRIYTAGKSLATTGGHADPSNGARSDLRGDPGPADGVIDGVRDAYEGVRARYQEGADLIKITATGGVLSQARSGQNPQFTVEEVEAVVAAARDYGFKVAAHAHGAEGMKRAVLGGVDSIEHGTLMTDEVMRLMKRQGTWYVPTISAGRFVAEKAEVPGYFSELVRPKAAAIGPQIQATFARAYAAGVKIAFGTDCGVCPHGENWREFGFMIESGMPPMEAVQSATVSAAELLGAADRLGAIEPGKLADIIAIPGDPLRNPALFGRVSFVMKGGVIYRND
ncbi:MAG: amidohydrolase family protein [Pseudomonadales bacterium]|nr:amidohydrolase family protein [Pseudomonadales bacterium]NIX08944.1 amidohydrolase family protein [Pseudomonadales bacterium]